MSEINTIFFDLDGTLYAMHLLHKEAMQRVGVFFEETYHISRELLSDCIEEEQQAIENRIGQRAPIHNRLIRFQQVFLKFGLPVFPGAGIMYRLYWDFILDNMRPEEGIASLLQALKSDGYHLIIATNMTAEIQYKKIEKLELGCFFEDLITSEEADKEKPDSGFFEYCLKKRKIKPENAMFIGDSLKNDVIGAQNVGIKGVYYHPGQLSEEPLFPVIRSYTDHAAIEALLQED